MLTMADLDEVMVEASARSAEMYAAWEQKFYAGGVRAQMTRQVAARPELSAGLPQREQGMVERRLKRLRGGE
jgi:hypothetical protein